MPHVNDEKGKSGPRRTIHEYEMASCPLHKQEILFRALLTLRKRIQLPYLFQPQDVNFVLIDLAVENISLCP